eukprot:5961597-Prymnesium_polylepis.1
MPMSDATDATDVNLMLSVFDDILCEIPTGTGALTPVTTVATGDEPLLCEFPELSAFDVTEYIDLDNAARYDPYEDKIVGEQEQLSARRRSELKRLLALSEC